MKVWNERHLARDGFGGILAVGQGSVNPPRMIVIEYRGGAKKDVPIALVGKAVTFDSGGISLKPGAAMDEMKWDKMGGCAVLGMMLAAADLKLPLNIIGVIPSAENLPGPDAYRPGDIITTRDGKTIEVLNTDAEGRIILADAIAHVRLTYKPSVILEYSTLTGAVIMALGHKRAGMFTSEEKLRDAFHRRGQIDGRTRLGPADRRRVQGKRPLRNRHGQEHQLPRRQRLLRRQLREILGRGNALHPLRHRRHRLDDQAARPPRRRRDGFRACGSRWRRCGRGCRFNVVARWKNRCQPSRSLRTESKRICDWGLRSMKSSPRSWAFRETFTDATPECQMDRLHDVARFARRRYDQDSLFAAPPDDRGPSNLGGSA